MKILFWERVKDAVFIGCNFSVSIAVCVTTIKEQIDTVFGHDAHLVSVVVVGDVTWLCREVVWLSFVGLPVVLFVTLIGIEIDWVELRARLRG